MKFEYALSALLACSTVADASPINIFGHKSSKEQPQQKENALTALQALGLNTTISSHNSSNTSNSSNSTTTYHNHTNSTATNTTKPKPTLDVVFTGGHIPISNKTNYTRLFNSSRALNLTELYDVAVSVNKTINKNTTKGAVVITNSKSLEGLGFFSSVVFNDSKPIVISEDNKLATIVANDKSAASRGPLVVTKDGLIYSGVFAPSSACLEECSGVAEGIVVNGKVQWFFTATTPTLVDANSTIRKTFKNFTSSVEDTTGLVPIVYDGEYSEELITSVSTNIQGLVVATTGSSNSTTSPFDTLPVVFAQTGALQNFVDTADVPTGSIAAGYLSPVKAQILLSIAAANGVTDTESLKAIFP
ncbi:hypothetical protein NCAS_0G02080 [Naumovozyma castellii]|uniref:asparaginase n=1 Tax=Naumovozyma castellii TaxID=27288 RepID=G0VI61_NAUCA|nr:hypothetical protein NCAS_0G02080 [Naumovozyma castellii CBS 4309]CCC71095.1 hypothetical protein NCAS_0G02080 [Naumovozyma castellii CBS 4309]